MERRLAAIMAADVVGYSRLIRADEEGTIAALKALRADLIDPKIAEHHGRIVKLMGDGMLAEFASVVDAVRAAVETQQAVNDRNAGLPEDKRIEFRVGINLGDVVIDGEDIHGDGVNVAARLEGLAPAGGICISGGVHDQVRDRLDLAFEDMGEQEVKNIARPIRVWRWPAVGAEESAPAARGGPLPLPDKPSIAVLPFDNMSGDPEQEYFADGIAEDIITAISRVGWLFVIARNSSFAFKGEKLAATELGKKLGVRYLLEGSVRKAGPRVRITTQLIEAETGNHLWAERYEGLLDDIFDLQDRITESVIGTIEPKLRATEIARTKRKRPDSLNAYDLLLRALPHVTAMTRADYDAAADLLDHAIAVEPTYAEALGYASWCRAFRPILGWSDSPAEDLRDALDYVRRALRADLDDPSVLRSAAICTVLATRDYQASLDYANRSLSIDPNSALTWGVRGFIHAYAGDGEDAIADFDRALRLSPFDVWEYFYELGKAFALNTEGRVKESLRSARRSLQLNPEQIGGYRQLAAALELAGEHEEARAMARKHQEIDPTFSVSRWVETGPFRRTPNQERVFAALRDAGLPD